MKLIVGLGNPGQEYVGTRHNVGFMVVDHLCQTLGCTLNQEMFNGRYTRLRIGTEDVVIAEPLTYMNLSGEFVGRFARYFKIPVADILVILDDINFPVGAIKIKPKGSSGGQNGMKDIIAKLGSEDIKRIKVGVGRPSGPLKDFVLSKFTPHEREPLAGAINTAAAAAHAFVTEDFQHVLSKYNR